MLAQNIAIALNLDFWSGIKPCPFTFVIFFLIEKQIEAEKKQTYALDEPVSHWRSRLTLNVMVEDFVFDGSSLPADVHRYMKM